MMRRQSSKQTRKEQKMELVDRKEVNELLHRQRDMQSRVNQLKTYDGCYLGSPCEYQNEDIIIPRWRERLSEMRSKDGKKGDIKILTNGDTIKMMFPSYDIEIDEHKGYVRAFYDDFYTVYPMRWWYAPYKEGAEE